ncbi:putative methyltransferase [Metabacillus crassostreae]|uniref:class I SAM-dependent methyltransferase n=1 Tax=Metabacillus crassostreae TaxID=929098 RepID=UPI00195848DF|nr:class I SAM-dependent methyltransferase [Metabacillus crassostreae]MBM7602093.1 putative methyltransferase [Metabacillus crassostreae]
MIVTTSSRPDNQLIQTAKEAAIYLNSTFIMRNKQAIEGMKTSLNENILVFGKNRIELHVVENKAPLFFHPNSAMFRLKRLIRGESDTFLDACQLKSGDSFLDCTLGLASDSIIASYRIGEEGYIQGIEASKNIAYIVKTGLTSWNTDLTELNEAMKRIRVISTDHLTYLKTCDDKSFDIVYFDPMFEESIEESVGLSPLKSVAVYKELGNEAIEEAKRVAKKRVVLKDHWKSSRFGEHGFSVTIRKSAKFHYGVIEIRE